MQRLLCRFRLSQRMHTTPIVCSHRYTPYKCTGPVYDDFPYLSPVMLICIVFRDLFLNHIPANTYRAMVAAWSPEMVTAPFLQMGKLLPEHSATSTFEHLRYITYGIFRRIFDKQMHMIGVYRHVNNLNIQFLTSLPDYRFSQHSHITNQYFTPTLGWTPYGR